MRVWDIPPNFLCDKHLLAQHLEIHTIHNVIAFSKVGYSKHPETLRWVHSFGELLLIHDITVIEMKRRGFNHKSPLEGDRSWSRDDFGTVDPIWSQIHSIYRKGCLCNLDGMYQWYDLIGQHKSSESDIKLNEIEKNHLQTARNSV